MNQFSKTGPTSGIYNREAFERLFRQYSKPLFHYASKFMEEEAARDIVQDLFVKLWAEKQITIRKSLNALLFTMIGNIYSDQFLQMT